MLQEINEFKLEENTNIVRYMSFTKFIDLILSESIFFVNGKYLSDSYELQLSEEEKRFYLDQLSNKYSSEEARKILEGYEKKILDQKKKIYINCWSQESVESYAMWKVYTTVGEGVSIISDHSSMKEAFKITPKTYHIGKVEYNDQLEPIENLDRNQIVFRKKEFYSNENEVRIYYYQQNLFDFSVIDEPELFGAEFNEGNVDSFLNKGFKVKVDLNKLINRIVISPFADKRFELLVRNFLYRTKPEFLDKIDTSKIMDE